MQAENSSDSRDQIQISVLKDAVDAILDHILNDLKIDRVTVARDEDYYWDMSREALHNVSVDPKLDVGRLTDDWEFLSKIKDDKRQAVALMLIHAAPLLRYIGEKIGR